VNPIKKVRLKALLRNCDYAIAGKVIKQQYYDSNKGTEINRLIDQFMANPGFEEALKLIDYNDMMVFYFTESCKDGLYLRKSGHEPARTASPQGQAQATANKVKEMSASFAAAIEEAAISLDEPFAALRELKSSETAEDQMKLQTTGNWKLPKALSRAEQIEKDAATIKSEPYPQVNSITVQTENEVAITIDVDAEAEGVVEENRSTVEVTEEQLAHEQVSPTPPVTPVKPIVPTVRRPKFDNVIATLQLDIHTMSKDLEDYRRQLAFFPDNDKQLKDWIRSLEAAIREFSQAIDLLEGDT
jgi:hypothetical protein